MADIQPTSSDYDKVTQALAEDQLTQEELHHLDLETQKANRAFLLETEKISLEEEKVKNEDRANARNMEIQVQSSPNASWLSKNIAHLIAILTLGAVFSLDWYVIANATEVLAKPENKDMINYILTTLNAGVLMAIIGFFFGSSSGSLAKTDQNREMMVMLHDLAKQKKDST